MPYVSPSNRTTGELITSTIWNQDIVANSQAGVPDIFTTAGDTVYATGADAAARLAIGAAGLVYRSTGSAPAWSNIAVPQLVRWTAQQDTTSTTLANVTTGVQAIAANEVWIVNWLLSLNATSTGGFKFAATVPAGATMSFNGMWSYAAIFGAGGQTSTSGTAIAGANTSSANTAVGRMSAVVVNGGTAGNIQLQFAQNTAAGTSSVLVNSAQISYRIS